MRIPVVATVVGAATGACATVGVLVGRSVLAPGPTLTASVALAATGIVAFLLMPEECTANRGQRTTVGRSL